jgi:hypothetical protein
LVFVVGFVETLHCNVSSQLITEGLAARMSASKAEFREWIFSRLLERTHLGDFLMEFLIGHSLFMLRRRSGATSLRKPSCRDVALQRLKVVKHEESMSETTPIQSCREAAYAISSGEVARSLRRLCNVTIW